MSVVLSILIAIAVAVALVVGSRLWFDRVQKRAHVQRIGVEVLNSRRWREALELLVQALAQEGYRPAAELTGPGGVPLAERLLSRGSTRALLIYKHGTSYRIGAPALLDAERRRQEAEVDEVIIATLGSVDADALAQAARMKVSSLDGATVWSKVQQVLDPGTRNGVVAEAEALVHRPRRLATVGAAIAGLAIVFWGGNLDQLLIGGLVGNEPPPAAVAAQRPAPAVPPSASAGAAVDGEEASSAVTTPDMATAPAVTAADAEANRRLELAKAVMALPEVERAVWSSASTMVISLRPRIGIDAGVEKTCALSAAYPALRDVRLQMEASGGSDVRWRRCV